MKTPKYHLYLTSEERSEVLKSLIDLKNALIEQGKYTDVIDEIIIKLSCARKKNIKVFLHCFAPCTDVLIYYKRRL